MRIPKAFLVIVPSIFLFSCSTLRRGSDSKKVHIPIYGYSICFRDTKATVANVWKDLSKGPLREGDHVLSFNGRPLRSEKDYAEWHETELDLNKDEVVLEFKSALTNKIEKVAVRKNYKLEIDWDWPITSPFRVGLGMGKKYGLLIIIEAVNFVGPGNQESYEYQNWRSAVESGLYAELSRRYVSPQAGGCGGEVSVMERGRLREMMEELKLQTMGSVDPQSAIELGKIAGATHIIFVAFNRYIGYTGRNFWGQFGTRFDDYINMRLVEIESSKTMGAANRRISTWHRH